MSKPWEQFTTQKQWKEYLQNLIRTNDRALFKAILLIDNRQTPREKLMGVTIENNSRGFSASDAPFLTSVASYIRTGRELSPKMIAISRNMMTHYWKQLYEISREKQNSLEGRT